MGMSYLLKLPAHWPEMDAYHLWTLIWDYMRENLGEIIAGWGSRLWTMIQVRESRHLWREVWVCLINSIWKRLSVLLYSHLWGLGSKPKGLGGFFVIKAPCHISLDQGSKSRRSFNHHFAFDPISARGQACPNLFRQYCWTLTWRPGFLSHQRWPWPHKWGCRSFSGQLFPDTPTVPGPCRIWSQSSAAQPLHLFAPTENVETLVHEALDVQTAATPGLVSKNRWSQVL